MIQAVFSAVKLPNRKSAVYLNIAVPVARPVEYRTIAGNRIDESGARLLETSGGLAE
jgi:hypothetical protein